MNGNEIKKYLPLVSRPSRYIGGEVNSTEKDHSCVGLSFALCFPDTYEVGMSHLGIQILYQIINSREDLACERAFAPWTDMEALLRKRKIPLSTLESGTPLGDFDVVGFSLQYELSYTNVLNMLDLGRIPLRSDERGEADPLVIGGGPGAFNPEPVAPFFDAFLLGDGEEAVLEICDELIEAKKRGGDRKTMLERLAGIKGVYVPSFFEVSYNTDGTVREIRPVVEGYEKVGKRIVADMEKTPLTTRPIVPFTETIHDRVAVEIGRGCTRGCRFCEAGMIYRPARERDPGTIIRTVREALKNTGYDDVSLLSLSAGDYTLIEELLGELMAEFVEEKVAVSLPSLRVGTLSETLAGEIKRVRKTGFTLAPEAGTERLRSVVNKGIEEADLIETAEAVFSLGWRSVKLYFMIGLPTETEEDVEAIASLAERVRRAGKRAGGGAPQINVSVSTFIPKPHTPFQWEPQVSTEECVRLQKLLRKSLAEKRLGFRWHDPLMSLLEGVFSRGDRRLSEAIIRAFRKGARFDGWGECFDFDLWKEAFVEAGLEMEFYTRRRAPEEVLPWEHLDPGVKKAFLREDYARSAGLEDTPDCKTSRCTYCGVCDHRVVKNVVTRQEMHGKERASSGEAKGSAEKEAPYAVRLRFSKRGEMRFLGHLELVNVIRRSVRRAGLPVRYSRGFHPLPRLSFSPPIPVGMESLEEYMEIGLDGVKERLKPEEVAERLNAVVPEGIRFSSRTAEQPPPLPAHLKLSTSSGIIGSTEYLVFLKDGPEGLKDIKPERIDGFLRDFERRQTAPVRISRGGRGDRIETIDLKPIVGEVSRIGDSTLRLVLNKTPGPRVRPLDVVVCLFNLTAEDASLIPILKTKTAG